MCNQSKTVSQLGDSPSFVCWQPWQTGISNNSLDSPPTIHLHLNYNDCISHFSPTPNPTQRFSALYIYIYIYQTQTFQSRWKMLSRNESFYRFTFSSGWKNFILIIFNTNFQGSDMMELFDFIKVIIWNQISHMWNE